MEDLIAFMMDMMVESADAMGMTFEEFETAYIEETGISLEDDIRQQFANELDTESLWADLESLGKYDVRGDKLFTTEEVDAKIIVGDIYETIEFSGNDVLKFLNTTDPEHDENAFPQYPFELKKVS